MPTLAPGTIIGGRFALVGELGTGGTATVWMAVDQLRGERVALKIVHGHLAGDPSVRRRLQREVAAAAVLRHESALVPWDLHELDGLLCLTLPYHPGQSLAEHVAATGPLPLDRVRELGVRVASALGAAHRSGLLHRDVTANNVLVEAGGNAMLTDFGLARIQADVTRSTGMLGTAGYAAPEVYAGTRADPRADLYGLGCVLYLALTGRTPFGTDAPMAVLQRQLAESAPPVRSLRPDCPEGLASLVHGLLRKDPSERPQSAGDVEDALRTGRSVDGPVIAPPITGRRVHLAPGGWAVVVREKDEDRTRRRRIRQARRSAQASQLEGARSAIEAQLGKRTAEIVNGVMAFVGIDASPAGEGPPSPEDLLAEAVAREGGVDPKDLGRPLALYEPRFVLARDVSEETAKGLAREARSLGFRSDPTPVEAPPPEGGLRAAVVWGAMAAGWLGVGVVAGVDGRLVLPWVAFMVFYSIIAGALAGGRRRRRVVDLEDIPVAYDADLGRALARAVPGRYPAGLEGEPPAREEGAPPSASVALPTRGAALLARAVGQIDALERTIAELGLSAVAASDLRDTARDLRERAADLADVIDRIDAELAQGAEDRSWIAPRLHRLRTKQRAGERVDDAEVRRLEEAQRASEEAEAASARLEARLTTATAGLLEIASTAARVRRDLLGEDPSVSAADALARLRTEARAADEARRELGVRAARRERA